MVHMSQLCEKAGQAAYLPQAADELDADAACLAAIYFGATTGHSAATPLNVLLTKQHAW
jgi:hypothetical protein